MIIRKISVICVPKERVTMNENDDDYAYDYRNTRPLWNNEDENENEDDDEWQLSEAIRKIQIPPNNCDDNAPISGAKVDE